MKQPIKIIFPLLLMLLLSISLSSPAYAITDTEVEAQVAAAGKEAVAGNVLIWFLCAVAFLKVSQKIDSFLSSLGINVGHTGGSMLSDAMIAMRAVKMATGSHSGPRTSAPNSGSSGASDSTGFFQGGLTGMLVHCGRISVDGTVRTFHLCSMNNAPRLSWSVGVKRAVRTNFVVAMCFAAGMCCAVGTALTGSMIHIRSCGCTGRVNSGCLRCGSPDRIAGDLAADNASHVDSFSQTEGVIQTDNTPVPGGTVLPSDSMDFLRPEGAEPMESRYPDEVIQTDNTPISETPVSADGRPSDGVIQTDNTPIPEQAVYAGSETQSTSESKSVGDVHTDSTHSSETTIPSTDMHTQLHTSHQSTVEHNTHYQSPTVSSITRVPSLGGVMFMRSLQSGGRFANDVIGTVARGDTRTSGTMTGDLAAQALTSYMSIPSPGEKAVEKVTYSQVEIGGGKIMGKEITPEHPTGLAFSMYHVDQYAEPKGLYEKVTTVDGAQWYKQVAVDTLVKTPSKIVDGKVEYNQEIVKRLPDPPRRKDKI